MRIFKFTTDDDVDTLSKIMMMTETGIERWVDGKEVDNPGDFTVYDTGFCKISTYGETADIYLILPEGNIENFVAEFVRKIEAKFHTLQQSSTNVQIQTSTFSLDKVDVINCNASIVTSCESLLRNRVFVYDISNRNSECVKALFKWNICKEFPTDVSKAVKLSEWFRERNSVIVDMADVYKGENGANMKAPSLKGCGILPKNTITLIRTMNNIYVPIPLGYELPYNNLPYNVNKGIKYKDFTDSKTADSKYKFKTCDFKSMEFEGKDDDPDIRCQCCNYLLYGPFVFALLSGESMFGVCDICFNYVSIIEAISVQLKAILIKLDRPLDAISEEQYGIDATGIRTVCSMAALSDKDQTTVAQKDRYMVIVPRNVCTKDIQTINKFRTTHKDAVIAALYKHYLY
jgi:hypothetical protein